MVNIVIYIDDTLILARSVEEMHANLNLTIDTFESAGFLLNYSKSQLTPCTKLDFLGFTIDTIEYSICLAQSKRENLLKINQLSNHQFQTCEHPRYFKSNWQNSGHFSMFRGGTTALQNFG